ncbi:MAG: hypothetical protein LVS60_09245 [Nodosilinea sp. LVE1205-7]|jgi:hypothetical protein
MGVLVELAIDGLDHYHITSPLPQIRHRNLAPYAHPRGTPDDFPQLIATLDKLPPPSRPKSSTMPNTWRLNTPPAPTRNPAPNLSPGRNYERGV